MSAGVRELVTPRPFKRRNKLNDYLDIKNFSSVSVEEEESLAEALNSIITDELKGNVFSMLGRYGQILADNFRRAEWDEIANKLSVLFKCGKSVPLDGPMIGVTLSIRDSDYFRETARIFGKERSVVADIEWMAICWNATFASTGLWMGKTFEPVSAKAYADACDGNPEMMKIYNTDTTRIGRNFFREPDNPNLIQGLGLPVLSKMWRLLKRPMDTSAQGFKGELTLKNLEKEESIPYVNTGGYFLANTGRSVVPEMNSKQVYQLNYRWPALGPAYPLTRLIDELVQIADGVYLGQLVMATHHYSLGTLHLPLLGEKIPDVEIGEADRPGRQSGLDKTFELIKGSTGDVDYGYQNNGFFLMIDPDFAEEAYSDDAFPYLRPRDKEIGYGRTASYGATKNTGDYPAVSDWKSGWNVTEALRKKFTTFCIEPSPIKDDGDVREMLRGGESILQMLQRIQKEISAQSAFDDHLREFEKLNRLFRAGKAPKVVNGLFRGEGKGYNTCFDAPEKISWYGVEEPCSGFNYYHGATLNLHFGFADTFCSDVEQLFKESPIFPTALLPLFQGDLRGPNLLNALWATIGRFVFPWAGKSFERISGRKLSMLLDESDNLKERYPERVEELKTFLASRPHYDLVKKNRDHFWKTEGQYAKHLKSGPWDNGMTSEDKEFWSKEASNNWVFGENNEDSRILAADAAFRVLDMNYHPPIPSVQMLADSNPSPFVRQGYIFLGVSDRESILSINNGDKKKRVFQFHYRYPMIGGPLPIGACLDELVEIAEGLFLGQLIYSTVPFEPFHSSVDPAHYKYRLFGYFLLLDNTWERHRQAIGFDTLNPCSTTY
jgi:hypothetical protein